MIAVRRRSRRRRTPVVPIDWRRIGVLAVGLLCLLVLVLNKKLSKAIQIYLTGARVALGGVRLEVVILALCGLVWFCLTPGIEDRILRVLKNRFEPRRRRAGGGRARRR